MTGGGHLGWSGQTTSASTHFMWCGRHATSCLRCHPSDPHVLQTFHGGSAFACVTSALGKVPAVWDADRLIHKFYRHSTVDQHPLTWHRHSAKYLLPEMSPIWSVSPWWISIHVKIRPQPESLSRSQSTCRYIRSMSWNFNCCILRVSLYVQLESCILWVAMHV